MGSYTFVLLALVHVAYAANDTLLVGSVVHETKIAAPDQLGAASNKKQDGAAAQGHEGHMKSKTSKDDGGYNTFDSYHMKDGDSFGYAEHHTYGDKDGGKKNGGYHQSSKYDEDEAEDAVKPKYTEWHVEEKSGTPAKSYRYESDSTSGNEKKGKGKLVGPGYKKVQPRSTDKKKEQDAAATEYENYEYADVEEAEPADFEGEEGEPEYAALYGDAEAYADYY